MIEKDYPISDEIIEAAAEEWAGTCLSRFNDFLPEEYQNKDVYYQLSSRQLRLIDEITFECASCGWMCWSSEEQQEYNIEDRVCSSCIDNYLNEEEIGFEEF